MGLVMSDCVLLPAFELDYCPQVFWARFEGSVVLDFLKCQKPQTKNPEMTQPERIRYCLDLLKEEVPERPNYPHISTDH